MKTLKHIGGLALAWGAFSTLFGLFEAFRAIEAWQGPLAASIIYGGMKVVLITILYGFTTYLISLLAYIIFKVVGKTS